VANDMNLLLVKTYKHISSYVNSQHMLRAETLIQFVTSSWKRMCSVVHFTYSISHDVLQTRSTRQQNGVWHLHLHRYKISPVKKHGFSSL